jgi:hypothetical protein
MKGSSMAKEDSVETIWASLGITKNVGNYESVRIDAGARSVASVGDEEAWKKLWKDIEDQVEAQVLELEENMGDK